MQSQQLIADATCITWVRSKLQLVSPRMSKASCYRCRDRSYNIPNWIQLRPMGQEDTQDSAEWLSSLWQNDVHTPIVSTFLMSVKATRMFALFDIGADHSQPAKLHLTLDVPKQYEQVSASLLQHASVLA